MKKKNVKEVHRDKHMKKMCYIKSREVKKLH